MIFYDEASGKMFEGDESDIQKAIDHLTTQLTSESRNESPMSYEKYLKLLGLNERKMPKKGPKNQMALQNRRDLTTGLFFTTGIVKGVDTDG